MKSLISSAKRYHSTVECRSEDMNLKNKRRKKSRDRQTDREIERERINFQIRRKYRVVLPPSPSKSTWVIKRNVRSTQADVSNILEYT